jgi:hypothetical protein
MWLFAGAVVLATVRYVGAESTAAARLGLRRKTE